MSRKEHKLAYVPPEPIKLLDHSEDTPTEEDRGSSSQPTADPSLANTHQHENNWARDCKIGECTIVKGTNSQRFAVWSVEITTTSHTTMKMFKRYSDFDRLRRELVSAFPDKVNSIPPLPPKKAFGNLQNDFLLKRRRGLEYFLSCVVLHPVLGNSEAVRKFVTVK